MTSITEDQQRSEYIAGLRELADLLEANPTLELPYTGRSTHSDIALCVGDRAQMVAWAAVLTDPREETPPSQTLHYLHGRLHGLQFKVFGNVEVVGGLVARKVMKPVTEYEVPSVLAEVSR